LLGLIQTDAELSVGEEVVIVGGGNSAGQAAVFLAETTMHVHFLVRKDGLAETMSRYLVRSAFSRVRTARLTRGMPPPVL
jgi:thioredoxin reductase (NADPH)